MPFIVKRIKLNISCEGGERFGADIELSGRFTVIRAENSRGKSTLLKSVVYGLGLEGMLGASSHIPLSPSVTDALTWEGRRHKVLDSEVYLVVSNGDGTEITVKRNIRGLDNQHNLISVWPGNVLVNGITDARKDYYANVRGAAQNPAGFHNFLAEFIGFKLPMVSRSDGGECPLYLQCIFPAFFIEQMRGWGGTLSGMPYQYGIRDVMKRVIEFILGLEINASISKREKLRTRKDSLLQQWDAQVRTINDLARVHGGIVEGIPGEPVTSWPPVTKPTFLISKGEGYLNIDEIISGLQQRLSTINSEIIPTVGQVVGKLHEQREALDLRVRQIEERIEVLNNELAAAEDYQTSISRRIEFLEDDLRKNQDEQKLQKMDGKLWGINNNKCPTCGQDWPSSLMRTRPAAQIMSIEENIEYVKSEIQAFQAMENKGADFIKVKRISIKTAYGELEESANSIREINETIVSRGTAPSMEAYKLHASLQHEIETLGKVTVLFSEHVDAFATIAEEYSEVIAALRELPRGELLTKGDEGKIANLQNLIQDQLKRYKFTSIEPENIEVDRANYHVISDGHDISSSISASDLIRLIWAYHIGLRKSVSAFGGNHTGILFLDEPRQQSANRVSFAELLLECASEHDGNVQTILATSEEMSSLEHALKDVKVQLVDFPKNPGADYIIAPIPVQK